LCDAVIFMQLPFTREQFYGVFQAYNEAVWPTQLLLLMLGVAALVMVFFPRRSSDVVISCILAFLWAWMAIAYHLAFFSPINPVSYGFAALFLGGSLSFLWQGAVRRRLRFSWQVGGRTVIAIALIAFALIVYPAWSWVAGHRYPVTPTFGLPCPTTIFTVGLLGLTVLPYPRTPLLAPVLWCFVGAQAAFLLGVPQDLGLLPTAVAGLVFMLQANGPAKGLPVRIGVTDPTRGAEHPVRSQRLNLLRRDG
jgi:hypothetical protein